MKKLNVLWVAIIAIASVFTSCGEDDFIIPTSDDGENVVSGNITKNTTWTADQIWELKGRVIVMSGVELTIEPGTIIKAKSGTGASASSLIIARGAKINAAGTASSPIIFTSVADDITQGQLDGGNLDPQTSRGFWGGVIILGNAPISSGDGDGSVAQIEGIPPDVVEGEYGGSDPTDNSGVFTYCSIRHGGTLIGEGNELNGLTLGGVGNRTMVDHIEVVGNVDDGIEFFGGTVNVSHALVWFQGDDGFDVDQAFAGTLSNFAYLAGGDSDHALEIDGPEGAYEDGFTFTNGTLIGGTGEMIDFRDNAQGNIMNCFFTGFDEDADIEIDDDASWMNYTNGDLSVMDNEFDNAMGLSIDDIAASKADNGDDAFFNTQFGSQNSLVDTPTVGADLSELRGWTLGDAQGRF